jgi:hypothetical protein
MSEDEAPAAWRIAVAIWTEVSLTFQFWGSGGVEITRGPLERGLAGSASASLTGLGGERVRCVGALHAREEHGQDAYSCE